jgi:HEAT repeats/Putative zinc-finger
MECGLAQQKIALYAYGELPDDQCHLLEGHLATCKRCQEEFAAVQALQQAMALAPSLEPSANLLAQARLQLEEALDNMPRSSWLVRAQQSFFRGVSLLGRAPVAASALLVFGLGTGGWAGYQSALRSHPVIAETPAAITGPATIANISSIVRDPKTENVEVRFNRLVPETAQGSLDDPQIRQLLLVGAESQLNPGVAHDSLSLLADECLAGHQCTDGPIRNALLVALRYDKSSGVRLRALNGLKPYVAEDMRVRDGVLEALMDDKDPSVRSRAIEVLQPVEADSSVREVLHTVASEDDNPHIRTVSREFLDESPQIQ